MRGSSLAEPATVTLKSSLSIAILINLLVPVQVYALPFSQMFISIIGVGVTFVALFNELNKELAKAKNFFFRLQSYFCPRVVH